MFSATLNRSLRVGGRGLPTGEAVDRWSVGRVGRAGDGAWRLARFRGLPVRSGVPVLALVAVALAGGVSFTHGCSGSDPAGAAGTGQAGTSGTAGKGGSTGGSGGSISGGSAGSGQAGSGGTGGLGGSTGGSGGRTVIGGNCAPIDPGNTILDSTWVQFSQFGCDCSFLISTADSVLPPIEWEPCKDITAVACEQMKPDPRMVGGHSWIYPRSFYVHEDGSFEMYVSRFDNKSASYFAFTDGSGKVSKGMSSCLSPSKSMKGGTIWLGDGTYSADIYPVTQGTEHGVVAGKVSEPLPTYVRRMPDVGKKSSAWAVSPKWVVRRMLGISVAPWLQEDGPSVFDPKDDPDGLAGYLTDIRGDVVFVDVEGGGQAGQMFWTEKGGIQPLVRYFGDSTRIAMRWGTDGKDMVWLYGEGELVPGVPYVFKNMVVKTAPYVLDAEEVAKSERVIGPNPIASGGIPSPFKVGCGHAATLSSNIGASVNGPAIVRLSDGVWWKILPNTLPYASYAMGVSCEHAYFAAPDGTPIRIPLASLPPGGMAGW